MFDTIAIDTKLNDMMNELKVEAVMRLLTTSGMTDAERCSAARDATGNRHLLNRSDLIKYVHKHAEKVYVQVPPVVEETAAA